MKVKVVGVSESSVNIQIYKASCTRTFHSSVLYSVRKSFSVVKNSVYTSFHPNIKKLVFNKHGHMSRLKMCLCYYAINVLLGGRGDII